MRPTQEALARYQPYTPPSIIQLPTNVPPTNVPSMGADLPPMFFPTEDATMPLIQNTNNTPQSAMDDYDLQQTQSAANDHDVEQQMSVHNTAVISVQLNNNKIHIHFQLIYFSPDIEIKIYDYCKCSNTAHTFVTDYRCYCFSSFQ